MPRSVGSSIGFQKQPETFAPVGIAGGLDTKSDPKLVNAPSVLQALNVRYGTAGSVRKRYGISALGALTGAVSVFSSQTELLACDSANMYAVGVGTGTLTTRGIIGAASVASGTLLSLGTLPTQVLRTTQCDYVTVSGVTYGLVAYEFGYLVTTNSASNINGMDIGTTIYLVLFNASTGAVIWTTSTQGLQNSSSMPFKIINSAGTVTVSSSGYGTPAGACHPTITVYNGQFIVSWISASTGATISDNGTSLSGVIYAVQSITFIPSATVPISGTSLSGASYCAPFPAVICGQPSSASVAFAPALPIPLYYDIRTTGSDVLLFAVGQNYGAASGTTPQTYRTTGGLAAFTNASTFFTPTLTAVTTTFLNTNACPVTLAPGTGVYGLVFALNYAAQLLLPTYSPASLAVSTISSTANNPTQNSTLNTPFSAVFTPSPTLPTGLTVSDGAQVALYTIAYTNTALISTAGITVQFAYNPILDYSNSPPPILGGQLASRLFLLNGAPVAWSILGTILRSTLSSLALATLPTYTGNTSAPLKALAHAAYTRTFNPGVPTDVNTPVPGYPYPRQASNVSTATPSGNPTIVYSANTNPQENTISLRTLSFAQDTVGVARVAIRTPQGVLYLGADPKYYDGNTCRSMGWEKIPEFGYGNGSVVATGALAGYVKSNYKSLGLMPGATYTFFFVFVDYDAQGNVIYGSPSPAYQVTVPTTANTYVLFIPLQMIPARGYLQVYRNTPLNPLSYVKTQQFSQANVVNYQNGFQGVVDDTGTGTAVNANGISSEILSGGLLYSNPSGGEVANDPPPPSSMGVATKQRIFLVSQEVQSWVFFSKPFYPGRAPEFAVGQLLDIDPTTGPITGIAALDTTIIVFKKNTIYSFSGDGPDATGAGAFTPTVQIATDSGCTDTPSVLTTQDGVWFRSARGLQLLSRGGQVAYVAPQVEGLLQGTTIVSSSIVAAQNQLRFALANGNVLVYDYLLHAWSVFVFFRPASATTSGPVSTTQFNGTVYTTNQAGDLCMESTGFQDGTNNLPMTLQSAWIPVSGPQGWGRIRRVAVLGTFQSAHTLSLGFSYDYNPTVAYNIAYTATTAAQQVPYNWRVRAPRQVCQAVQLTITDNAPPGEGAVIAGLVLELGPKSQALRVPDTQSV